MENHRRPGASAEFPDLSTLKDLYNGGTTTGPREMAVYPNPIRSEFKLVATMRFEVPSISASEIAKRLGRSPASVLTWLKKPEYQAYESWYFEQQKANWTPYDRATRAAVADTMQEYASDMLQRLIEIAEITQDERLAASISQDFLDRAGYAPQHKAAKAAASFNLTGEAMEVLLRRRDESLGTVHVGEVIRKEE